MIPDSGRHAALQFLATWWKQGPSTTDGSPTEESAESFLRQTGDYVDADLAVGLLSEDEAEQWRQRYRIVAADNHGLFEDAADEIDAYVARTLDAVSEPVDPSSGLALHLHGTLHAAGALATVGS